MAAAVISNNLIERCNLPRDAAARERLRAWAYARLYAQPEQGNSLSGVAAPVFDETLMTGASETALALPCSEGAAEAVALALLALFEAQPRSTFSSP